MKKVFVILIALSLMLGLTACGGTDKGTKKVAIMTPYLSSVTTNQMVDLLKKQATAKGWEPTVVDTKGDVGQLVSRMEDVIARNVDAIVLVSTDPNQVKAQIQSAKAKNIPVFGCDAGYIEGMAMNATSDNKAMSKMITEYLFQQLGDQPINLVVLTHRPHPGVLKRTQQFDELRKQNPNIKKVIEQHVDVPGPIENARKQMENILLANKKEGSITAVWAGWDEPAIGATQALQAVGRKDVIVTGIDGNSQAVDLIKQGSPLVATVKQNFTGMAEIVIKQLELVFQDKNVEGTELYAPATLITKENAGE
jgi:ribose transport system substrate-binding protein